MKPLLLNTQPPNLYDVKPYACIITAFELNTPRNPKTFVHMLWYQHLKNNFDRNYRKAQRNL